MSDAILRRLRLSNLEIEIVTRVVQHHVRPAQLAREGHITNRAAYRFFRDTGDAGIDTCIIALADWRGGSIAREAKALAPSAQAWAESNGNSQILYQEILDTAVRTPDPFVRLQKRWIVRRLAPDCSRIELSALPKERDSLRLLHAMGFETANVHLGSIGAQALAADLKKRPRGWLYRAAQELNLANPHAVLSKYYSFYLERRAAVLER